MVASKQILMVVTSHNRISDVHPTGLWFDEFAEPFRLFREQGYRVTVASPKGGKAPIDPRSMPEHPEAAESSEALAVLEQTVPLTEIKPTDYDAVFFPGGHGTMYDLPENPIVTQVVERFAVDDKVIAAVCHGPAALIGPTNREGAPLVWGRRIAAFTNDEERAVELDQVMPFLLETRLKDLGARFEKAPVWADQVVVDGKLVTGQNPQSSASAAREVIRLLSD